LPRCQWARITLENRRDDLGVERIVVVYDDGGALGGAAGVEVELLSGAVAALVALADGLRRAGGRGVALDASLERGVEGDLQEDGEIPVVFQFGAEEEDAIEEEDAGGVGVLWGRGRGGVGAPVEEGGLVVKVAARPKRVEEERFEGRVVEGVVEVAFGRVGAAMVANGAGVVEAVNGGADDGATTRPHGLRQLVGEGGLARRVYAVNGDADGVGPLDGGDSVG
jgi:hypothetical protein